MALYTYFNWFRIKYSHLFQNSSVYGNSGLYSTSSIPYGYQTTNKIGSKDSQVTIAFNCIC